MNQIEELIRATRERQADRAVPVERIRAGLTVRARVRRRQRWGVGGSVVAAAAVAVAIAVPTLVARPPAGLPGPVPVAVTPTKPATPARIEPTGVPAVDVALSYRPAWMPAGYSERTRENDAGAAGDGFGPTLMRVWRQQVGPGDRSVAGPEIVLMVRTAVPDPATAIDDSGRRVDINGQPGYYSGVPGDHKSGVGWVIGPHTLLVLSADHLNLSEKDLLRIARSVRPDPGVTTSPFELGWLPAGLIPRVVQVSGPSRAKWRAEIMADDGPRSVQVIAGSTAEAPAGGSTLTVAGHPARHPVRSDAAGQDLSYLVVDLGPGRYLTLIGQGIPFADLTRIAGQAQISPTGLGWLGG